jgi:hypothetical protein
MRTVISFFLLAFMVLVRQSAFAYDFVADGLAYKILSVPSDAEFGSVGVTSIVPIKYNPDPYEGTQGYPNYPDLTVAVIPDVVEHEGKSYQVTQILDLAFSYSQTITHVQIAATVTDIGKLAFYKCLALKEITIPHTVTHLGESCFALCSGLESVCIQGALEIPTDAFFFCTQLQTVDMPNVYGALGFNAFQHCKSLLAIDIPDGVTEIRSYAFNDCQSLESLHIGKSVQKFQCSAFFGTPNLKKITVAPENATFDSRDNCNAIIYSKDNEMRFTCSTSVIPSTVKKLYDVFNGLKGREHIEIPEGIEVIHDSFTGCDMKSLTLSSTVNGVYGSSFSNCNSLRSISVSPQNKTYASPDSCNAIISSSGKYLIRGCNATVIPSTVEEIGSEAFINCKGLETLRIPAGVTTIYKDAFRGCDNLRVLYYDAQWCFPENTVIYEINVHPDDMGMISYDRLGATPFPHDFTTVIQLDSVVFGPQVREIPDYLLWGQKNIKHIQLPSTVEIIGEGAFANSGLQQVTLPQIIRWISRSAFSDTPLEQVYCMAGDPSVAQVDQAVTPFDHISEDCVLHVPNGRKQSFESHPAWSSFKTVVEMHSNAPDVNGDNSIDAVDINVIVNVMLNHLSPTSRADVNGDGVVDIADINLVINTMLSKGGR